MVFSYYNTLSKFQDEKSEITVKILLFAGARELSGEGEAELLVQQEETYSSLFEKIVHRFKLEKLQNCLILAVNEEYPTEEQALVLKPGDQIAVIPPLSGGIIYFKKNNISSSVINV